MSATKRSSEPRNSRAKKKKKNAEPDVKIPHFDDEQLVPEWMDVRRTKVLTFPEVMSTKSLQEESEQSEDECVLYWMQRDMRTVDNWALFLAQHIANERGVPLRVVYTLPPPPPPSDNDNSTPVISEDGLPPKAHDMPMTQRHATFLLRGLRQVEKELHARNIPLHILKPTSRSNVGLCLYEFGTGVKPYYASSDDKASCVTASALAVVCDFTPLRHVREWMEDQAAPLLKDAEIPLIQVDAHNVVPVWCASPKREVGARTLRPKINKLLPDFFTDFPDPDEIFLGGTGSTKKDGNDTDNKKVNYLPPIEPPKTSWQKCAEYLRVDLSIPPSTTNPLRPGTKAAMKRFDVFLQGSTTTICEGLKTFDTHRNDPNYQNVCTNMSPWINHGHVSFQRLALLTKDFGKYPNGTASYIEEGIVRRELSDNFVYYSRENYDDLSTAAVWAQDSLELHSVDEREYVYSLKDFVEGRTHDDLWNAAQLQVVNEGKMHGFLRMYWAKKILEWTESPAIALRTGLYLNDRYALDGNDPNGFVGVGWSMMGIHDMGWKERPIFGKIRFMNYPGCKRKFNIANFVARYPGASENAENAAKKYGKSTASSSTMKKRKR